MQTNFYVRGSTCCDPCWRCTQSHSTMPLVSELGRGPKPQYISAMEHLFPFRGGGGGIQGPNMLLHFSVLPHCMTVYFGKRRLAPETQSWQSTPCHFNEASWCHENAAGRAMLQDGQHCAAYLGKVRRGASAVCTISSSQGGKKSSMQSLNVRLLQERVPTQITERA